MKNLTVIITDFIYLFMGACLFSFAALQISINLL